MVLLGRKAQGPLEKVFAGTLLTALGVIFNRVNVVLLAMNLKGAIPQTAPEPYWPTILEWGISIGLISRPSSSWHGSAT